MNTSALQKQAFGSSRPIGKSQKKSDHVAYGIILFDQTGKFLVLENSTSYGFSSFLNCLCNPEFTDYDDLFAEFSPDELNLLRSSWTSNGLEKIITEYFERGFEPRDPVKPILQAKFRQNWPKMLTNWNSLIQIIDPKQLPHNPKPRIHDFPKARGPEGKKWKLAQDRFKQEIGIQVPSGTQFETWFPVQYYSTDNSQYKMEFLIGRVDHFEPPDNRAKRVKWVTLDQVNFVPQIMALIKAYLS